MSRWTFSTVSFTDPTEPNPDENAGGAMQVSAITEGAVYPEDGYEVKIKYYHPSALVAHDIPPGDNSEALLTEVSTESVTENVRLTWGEGNTSFPNTSGNTKIYDAAYKNEPVASKSITYIINYKIYELSAPTTGTHDVVFMFSDNSHINIASFQVIATPACGVDNPGLCLTRATCESWGGYWYAESCHLEPCGPQLYAEIFNAQDEYRVVLDVFNIHVYFYHHDLDAFTEIIASIAAGDDSWVQRFSAIEFESILQTTKNENLRLEYGHGIYSLFDLDGNRDYYDPAYADESVAFVDVSYDIKYFKFRAYGNSAGDHILHWKWSDKSAETEVNFTAIDCSLDHVELCFNQADCEAVGAFWYGGVCHLEPLCQSDNLPGCYDQANCEAVGGYWYDGSCHAEPEVILYPQLITITRRFARTIVVGASITIDGVYIGVTDSLGQITTPEYEVGTSHEIVITSTATGSDAILDSDSDYFENDSFVAGVPT